MRHALRPMMIGICFAAAPLLCSGAAQAGDVLIYDFASPYLQRMDRITPGAGNANDVNTVTHMVDPWPRNVGNRHITFDAERMANAYERYRDVRKLPLTPPPIAPTAIGTSGFSSGSGGTSTSTTSTGSR
jgi:hypothetical protein